MKTKAANIKTADATMDVVQNVSTEFVHVSVLNTRQPTEKEVTASGLLQSIKNQGQLTPGLGRPHPDMPGHIELAAGACRRVACHVLQIPYRVVVRPMTDDELLDAILTENLQRTNPDPEAEAALIERRLAEGLSVPEIAAKYGKDPTWVRRRIKILKIIPALRKLMAPGKMLAHFTTQMKERVGDLPDFTQKTLTENWGFRRAENLEALNRTLSQSSCSLEDNPWIDDPDTAVDGCGPGCKTSTVDSLFPDPHMKCGACLNSTCFKKRRALAVDKAITTALGDQKLSDFVIFSTDYGDSFRYQGKEVPIIDSWRFRDHYKISKKKTDFIGLNVKDPLNPQRAYLEKISKGKNAGTPGKPSESREDKLTAKRLALMNERIKAALEKASLPTTVPILQLVAIFGTCGRNTSCMSSRDAKLWDLVTAEKLPPLSLMSRSKDDTPENTIWISVRSVITQRLAFHRNLDLLHAYNRNEMSKIAWLIGFDYDAEWTKICTTEVLVPKSWGPGIDPITLKAAKGVVIHANIPGSSKSKLAAAATKTAKKAAKSAKKKPKSA